MPMPKIDFDLNPEFMTALAELCKVGDHARVAEICGYTRQYVSRVIEERSPLFLIWFALYRLLKDRESQAEDIQIIKAHK